MRSSAIVFVAALVSSVVAAPVALAPRTSTTCWPGCSASNPNPSVQAGLGLTVQVGLWATVDVPRIIAQLQAAINAGNAAACSTAQTALLDLRAKINVAATLNTVDVITARTCSALVVKLDAAVKAAVDVDAAALVTVDATVKAIASLQAAIAANAVADVSASISALVALRAKLVVALSATVGTTRDRCQDAIGQIDVSAQLCLDIVAHISAQLDAAVRANVDADVKVALSLVAQLRAALKVGVNAGAAFGDNCKSALVKLDVSIAACLTIIINAAKVAVGGAVRATIQASVDVLVLAKACLDVNVSIFASLTAVLGSCTRALGQ